MIKNTVLDSLVEREVIKNYTLLNVDADGVVTDSIRDSWRNTERLLLTFPDGTTLKIDTFCSGSSENTDLLFEEVK
jgi:hypothetical protein